MLAQMRRHLQSQSGVALVTAMLAIFILTVVVAALALATMGETGLSFDQSRSGQAFHLAEAGAYRALAELRRRITADLPASVPGAGPGAFMGPCSANQGWRIIATYGGPGWSDDVPNHRATLNVGTTATPVEVRDAGGSTLGAFFATIYVRPADNRSGPVSPPQYVSNTCGVDPATGIESYRMPFDYFIVATGVTRNAQRTVCLKNPGNLANCGEWLAASNPDSTTWDSAPVSHAWEVLIEAASYSRWALMLLSTANTWLTDSSVFAGPVHSNTWLQIWGDPTFGSTVTQVDLNATFGNGGSPVTLMNDENPPTDVPTYLATRMQRDASPVAAPTNNSPFWAVLDDPSGVGIPPDLFIRQRTTQLVDNGSPAPNGIYFMDECANPTCGGIFVQGNVNNLVLCISGTPQCPVGPGVGGRQHIVITRGGQQVMYALDSSTNTKECTGPPAYSTCVDKGKGFNGMLYVNGSILRSVGNPTTGLYGTVQSNTRLTIAADGEIFITDHLTYQTPPNPTNPYDPIPNVLGIYSWCSSAPAPCASPRNVTVAGSMTPTNLAIHASVLAPWGKFWVLGWDTLPDKGTMRFLGGTVQADFGEWGGFLTDAFGNVIGYTAYGRDMTYDQRFLTNNAPPFFPLTNQYAAPRFPRLNPDPLYDRPLWEELTAQ